MLEQTSIIGWIQKNDFKTENGDKFDLHSHYFMYDPLIDMASLKRDIVVYKAAQIGFSTTAMIASFWIAKNKGTDII